MMTIIIIGLFATQLVQAQQQEDPMTLNGGSVLAMAGDECVALAVDKRFGSGPQVSQTITIST
jgi:20S proteasome alpha/beta subunit